MIYSDFSVEQEIRLVIAATIINVLNNLFTVIFPLFYMAHNGLALGEGGDFHHKT